MTNNGVWKKGRKKLTGKWQYNWAADCFWIRIDGKDPGTGLTRDWFQVHGDHPEFNGWKLQKETTCPKKNESKK